jgi:hypothetical protein
MAIQNSIANFPGVGGELYQNIAVAIAQGSSPQAVSVPSSGSFSPAITRGWFRFKIYGETTAITISSVVVTATDGTNTVSFSSYSPSLAITSTAYIDKCEAFNFDTTTAGGGATGSLIFGGATSFTFTVTDTGSSGACKGDFEVYGEP